MPLTAYTPDQPEVDQGMGPRQAAQGSRFNSLDSRGPIKLGASATEAIAEARKGTFTPEDLKQLAFAMGFQIIEGKDTAALAAKIAGLEQQNAELQRRAEMAELAHKAAAAELQAARAGKK